MGQATVVRAGGCAANVREPCVRSLLLSRSKVEQELRAKALNFAQAGDRSGGIEDEELVRCANSASVAWARCENDRRVELGRK
jgi:hypothetical protein